TARTSFAPIAAEATSFDKPIGRMTAVSPDFGLFWSTPIVFSPATVQPTTLPLTSSLTKVYWSPLRSALVGKLKSVSSPWPSSHVIPCSLLGSDYRRQAVRPPLPRRDPPSPRRGTPARGPGSRRRS